MIIGRQRKTPSHKEGGGIKYKLIKERCKTEIKRNFLVHIGQQTIGITYLMNLWR
jgi:hypothetical protein